MKKTLVVCTLALLALAGCKNAAKTGAAAQNSNDSTATVAGGAIAYVNLDSLTASYDMYKDLRATYEQKTNRIQNDVNARGRALQKDIADFQEKVNKGLVTQATAAQMQDDLGKRQQSFMDYRDKVSGDLAEEEQVLLNQIHESIVQYLKQFNADYHYSMIISTSSLAGPVLNADPKLDITKEVVKGLNKAYAQQQAKAPKESKK